MYYTDYCFTSQDIYDTAEKSKLGINMNHVRAYKQDMIRELCSQIFTYFFYLVVLDIIENNVTFVLPAVGRKAYIYVKPITGEKFEYLYRMGTFDGLDYLKTNFTGYRLMYQYQTSKEIKEKPIYISKELKQRLFKNANEGMVYY